MRTISEQELKDILDKHFKWLRIEENGERANLRSADLSYANLSYANLSSADLRSAVGFKHQPIQLVNMKYFTTIFDDHVQWGCRKFTFDELKALKFEELKTTWNRREFNLNKKIIKECIRYYRANKPCVVGQK
jgi:hypothetical protein